MKLISRTIMFSQPDIAMIQQFKNIHKGHFGLVDFIMIK